MTRSADHFEAFEPHTRLKHLILKTYLQSWARKLLLRKGAGDTVYFIDACAGPGMDDVGNHGSPIIAAREAAMAEAQVSDMLKRPAFVRTIAIEKRAGHFNKLAEALAPFGEKARAIRGELVDHLPGLLRTAGNAPVLCFIDPFGVEPLRANVVQAILDRPQGEVFVLFADQACLRHFGAAAAAEVALAPPEPDLFSLVEPDTAPPPTQPDRSDEALTITAERAREILDSAFAGPGWYDRIMAVPKSSRRAEFLRMYCELLQETAPYVLAIPMRNDDDQHVYHLIHASRSAHGHATMKDAVSHALKHTDLAESATRTIRFAIRSNIRAIAEGILTRFSGLTVPWTTASDEGHGPLKAYVLAETRAYPHELPALQEQLKPYRLRGQKVIYAFPGEPQPGVLGRRHRDER